LSASLRTDSKALISLASESGPNPVNPKKRSRVAKGAGEAVLA
jgi:hypothetical protein